MELAIEADVDEEITAALRPLIETRSTLASQQEELDQKRALVRRNIARIDALLRAGGVTVNGNKNGNGKPKLVKKRQAPERANDVFVRIIRWLAEQSEPASAKDMQVALSISDTTVNRWMKFAREHGVVLFAGRRATADTRGREAVLYKASPDAIERLERVMADGN